MFVKKNDAYLNSVSLKEGHVPYNSKLSITGFSKNDIY